MKETILILGATGRTANYVAQFIARTEQNLRVASSRERGVERLQQQFPTAKAVLADWHDEMSLMTAFEGVDRVLFIPADTFTDPSLAANSIINAAKKVGTIKQIMTMIALPEDYQNKPFTEESLVLRMGANLSYILKPILEQSGLPITFVNVRSWINFNMQAFWAEEIKQNQTISYPSAFSYTRAYLDEADIAELMFTAMQDKFIEQ